MPYRTVLTLATAALAISAAPALAQGPAVGCTNLPEHDRAVGTVENGAYSCGMSMEEAQKILARDQRQQPTGGQGAAPAPRKHHRRKVPQQ